MAAGGDHDIPVRFLQDPVVFTLDDRRADCGLLNIVKAELLQRGAHGFYAHAGVVGDKGRREADDYGSAALQQNADLFGLINDLLGVLRTHNKAVTAKNALVADYMRLISGKAYGLYRTVADAFITVFAI